MKKLALVQSILIVVLIISFFLLKGCYDGELGRVKTEYEKQLTEQKMENQALQQVKDRQGRDIQLQDAIITSKDDVITDISNKYFDLKKKNEKLVKQVKAFSSQITETKIDSVPVPFVDTVERQRFADSVEKRCAEVIEFYESNYIKVPRTAKQVNNLFSADLTASKTGININNLSVVDSSYTRIVEKKGGFFRKTFSKNKKGVTKFRLRFHVPRSIEFQSFHTNPLVKVRGQTSIVYIPKKKAKWVGPLLVGAVGGYFLSK